LFYIFRSGRASSANRTSTTIIAMALLFLISSPRRYNSAGERSRASQRRGVRTARRKDTRWNSSPGQRRSDLDLHTAPSHAAEYSTLHDLSAMKQTSRLRIWRGQLHVNAGQAPQTGSSLTSEASLSLAVSRSASDAAPGICFVSSLAASAAETHFNHHSMPQAAAIGVVVVVGGQTQKISWASFCASLRPFEISFQLRLHRHHPKHPAETWPVRRYRCCGWYRVRLSAGVAAAGKARISPARSTVLIQKKKIHHRAEAYPSRLLLQLGTPLT
jgi:hypothetical protein